MLKEEMQRSGISFREAINRAVRRGLANSVSTQRKTFKLRPQRLSLRTGIDPAMVQHFEEDLEIEGFLRKTPMILPDANLILYAYDLESPFHPLAANWWTKCAAQFTPQTPTSSVSQA